MFKKRALKPKTKQWCWFAGLYFASLFILGAFSILAHLVIGH